jgi:hypothetical protein
MNKKLIFALLAAIILAGALFFFRNQKKTEETQRVSAEAFNKLTEVAQKVPQAGLPQMGAALIKYYKKNYKYPARLGELYPEFVPNKNFLDDINWYYEPRGGDFFLSKSITRGSEQLVASIDKSLEPRMGTGGVVASVSKPKPAEIQEASSPALALAPLKTIQPIEPLNLEDQEKDEIIAQPEVVSMVEGEIGHGIPSDVSQKFLVWRDKNGVLGFGNVIYPDTQTITIYKDGNWVNIKKPVPQKAATIGRETAPGKAGKRVEGIASDYSKNYLVWKDKKGNIGVGNVQYPGIENISYICVNGNWQKVVN